MQVKKGVSPLLRSTRSMIRKLMKSLRRRGLWGTFTFSVRYIFDTFDRSSPMLPKSFPDPFDQQYDIDTDGIVELSELDVYGYSYLYGIRYQPTPANLFREMLHGVPINYEDFVFIDLGSGKGRVLLLASEYPFKKIIGVEFSMHLHQIAQRNILRYQNITQQCKEVESICMDAADYSFPNENVVIYLYHPFEEEVMRTVLANLLRLLEAHRREIVILYYNPSCGKLLEEAGFIKKQSAKEYSIYWHQK